MCANKIIKKNDQEMCAQEGQSSVSENERMILPTDNSDGSLFNLLDVQALIIFAGTNNLVSASKDDHSAVDIIACGIKQLMNVAVASQQHLRRIIVYSLPSRSDISERRLALVNQAIRTMCEAFVTSSKHCDVALDAPAASGSGGDHSYTTGSC